MNSYFSFTDGAVSFVYYPDSGMVKVSNPLSFFRSIEFFAFRGFQIDWNRSNINTLTMFLLIPYYLEGSKAKRIITTTTEDMHNQAREDLNRKKEAVKGNVDNSTGKMITFSVIESAFKNLARSNKDRQGVADWFNRYNIDEIKKEAPILRVSTKSKKTIMEEGKRAIRELYSQGRLRKLTEEEYLTKMRKYEQKTKDEDSTD